MNFSASVTPLTPPPKTGRQLSPQNTSSNPDNFNPQKLTKKSSSSRLSGAMGAMASKMKSILTTTKRGSIFVTNIGGRSSKEGSPKDSSGETTISDELRDSGGSGSFATNIR